jgi:hypothetical protein
MTLWAYVVKIKVKQSHYGPEQTNRVPGVWGSPVSRQSAHEGGLSYVVILKIPLTYGQI